jgi:energy-coupling factor transporter transmembrane protein EcfT
MKWIKKVLAGVASLFTSGKAQAAFDTALKYVPRAIEISKAIAALTPTRADDEIIAAFERYAVPFMPAYLSMPVSKRGYLLLSLATDVLAREAPGVATNVLNTAVQLAVTGERAK